MNYGFSAENASPKIRKLIKFGVSAENDGFSVENISLSPILTKKFRQKLVYQPKSATKLDEIE